MTVAFVANGLGGPSFLARLPERQSAVGLSDAGLGLVLVGMAVGAAAASPLAGRWIGRAGSRPVLVASALALGATLWSAGAAPRPVALFGALVVIGAADAAMDIAMNANGAAGERRTGRSVMHRLHGAWSLGALAGAGLAAAAAGLGLSPTWHLTAVGVAVAVGVVATRDGLVDDAGDVVAPAGTTEGRPAMPGGGARPGRARRALTRPLVVLGAATVGGAVIEGAPADWSAIRLERLGTGPGPAALGLAAFMTGMLAGRLVGDRLTDRFGAATVLRAGMAAVAAGLLAGALADHPAVFALGLVVAGWGASGFFPLAFSAAGATPGVAPGAGAAVVSLAARVGFLVEPLAMGALADLVGLRWAFLAVGAVALVLAAAAPTIVPPATRLTGEPLITDVRAV